MKIYELYIFYPIVLIVLSAPFDTQDPLLKDSKLTNYTNKHYTVLVQYPCFPHATVTSASLSLDGAVIPQVSIDILNPWLSIRLNLQLSTIIVSNTTSSHIIVKNLN